MRQKPVPILMYHSIAEDTPPATRRLSVDPEAFAAQMRRLKELDFTTLPFGELAARLTSGGSVPDRTIALTFDDGYADFWSNALPVLRRHDFTATLFVATGWLDDAGASAAGRPLDRMLTSAQVRQIADTGIEIGAHSHSHAELDQLRGSQLESELRDSKALLEDITGREVPTLAYPFGYSSRSVRAAVAANGYRYAAVVGNRGARPSPDPMALPRLTIRRSTDLAAFERIAGAQRLGRAFLKDRILTRGYAVVRRGREGARKARGRV